MEELDLEFNKGEQVTVLADNTDEISEDTKAEIKMMSTEPSTPAYKVLTENGDTLYIDETQIKESDVTELSKFMNNLSKIVDTADDVKVE